MESASLANLLFIPQDIKCSISNKIFEDPVIASDGYSYDRAAIEKHLLTSLKSPKTGNLLPTTSLTPNTRKLNQVRNYLASRIPLLFEVANRLVQPPQNSYTEALELLAHLKEISPQNTFFEHPDWINLAIEISERLITSLSNNHTSNVDEALNAALHKLAPLKMLYEIYLSYYLQDNNSPLKEHFSRTRFELSKVLFSLGEEGWLEEVLSHQDEFNNAPQWRMLVNVQTSLGWKKKAAQSCLSMAKFAEDNQMIALAATSRDEALVLDPSLATADPGTSMTASFMTKEELKAATRDEIFTSFIQNPGDQFNFEHLIDLLEDEGAIISAVRILVAHALTKHVPIQFQAGTAMELKRLVTLLQSLQYKYTQQLQLLVAEVKKLRTSNSLDTTPEYTTPDLTSLLGQLKIEEEFKTIIPKLLGGITTKLSPPQIPVTQTQQANTSPANEPYVIPNVLPANVNPNPQAPTNSSTNTAPNPNTISPVNNFRATWGIKPGQGKDRNKRFTMGMKAPVSALGSRGPAPVVSVQTLDPNSKPPSLGRPPANFNWGPNSLGFKPTFGVPAHLSSSNPELSSLSQSQSPPASRLHTPSVLSPFELMPVPHGTIPVEESPFSTTLYKGMPGHSETPNQAPPSVMPSDSTATEAPQTIQEEPVQPIEHKPSSEQWFDGSEPPPPPPEDEMLSELEITSTIQTESINTIDSTPTMQPEAVHSISSSPSPSSENLSSHVQYSSFNNFSTSSSPSLISENPSSNMQYSSSIVTSDSVTSSIPATTTSSVGQSPGSSLLVSASPSITSVNPSNTQYSNIFANSPPSSLINPISLQYPISASSTLSIDPSINLLPTSNPAGVTSNTQQALNLSASMPVSGLLGNPTPLLNPTNQAGNVYSPSLSSWNFGADVNPALFSSAVSQLKSQSPSLVGNTQQ